MAMVDHSRGGQQESDWTSMHGDESTCSNKLTSSSFSASSALDDTPEALVRRENQAVAAVRWAVVGLLLLATLGTSVLVFIFARNSEKAAYDGAFDSVGDRIVDSFLADVALKFGLASTIADSILLAMETSNLSTRNLTISQSRWESITDNARFTGNVELVNWGPILRGDEERREFEEFASTQSLDKGANPKCFMCGDGSKGFVNLADEVEFAAFGWVSCKTIQNSGLNGLITADQCPLVRSSAASTCICGELPEDKVDLSEDLSLDIPESLFRLEQGNLITNEPYGQELYHPYWQVSAIRIIEIPIMYNQYSEQVRADALDRMFRTGAATMSDTYRRVGPLYKMFTCYINSFAAVLYFPVKNENDEIVAAVSLETTWNRFITGVFPVYSDYVDVVISNRCSGSYTYTVDTETDRLIEIGEGDLHDPAYEDRVFRSSEEAFLKMSTPFTSVLTEEDICPYTFSVYSTKRFEDMYRSNGPMIYALVTAFVFVFTTAVFLIYDVVVRRRQAKVMASANRTNDIVASLFPENVRQRMFEGPAETSHEAPSETSSSKAKMHNFLTQGSNKAFATDPIADLFPHATVMILDIVGFTCWASERTPSDVFALLERLYGEFDKIAQRMGVFKVETIGDSYVAVCGLPKPRANHAVVMARFAQACLRRMLLVTKELELYLGPSTADLRARIGLHSGPVTAGVMRGEKARFQLFGDTVNVASRIEASGNPHQIHASKETGDLLVASGKQEWVTARASPVILKGKGEFRTCWILPVSGNQSVGESSGNIYDDLTIESSHSMSDYSKTIRLVDWNAGVLYHLLQDLVADRGEGSCPVFTPKLREVEKRVATSFSNKICIEEMTEILKLPKTKCRKEKLNGMIDLGVEVREQLREFILEISNLYLDVPFHNFEHCSHVIMSASKLMKRIMDPDGIDHTKSKEDVASDIHRATYGMSSDSMMAFAVVFSALIHDVDHKGVTNQELCAMDREAAARYREKSVAEQNSVDVAWSVLMDDRFSQLRACIYSNEEELRRFRQLIVNAVMATDIADKELKTIRESRWDAAFSVERKDNNSPKEVNSDLDTDRKGTIVFEYIIQASDVAHTMQHWHTYQKFNKRLFEERYLAFRSGYCDKDPSLGWYGGELWFFDNYILPLAQKLKDCGVFGVSHFEFLSYAKQNRGEWDTKGEAIVADMLKDCQEKYSAGDFAA